MTLEVLAVGERVLIQPITVGDELPETSSGIVMPDSLTAKKLNRGLIISVGQKVSDEVREGDMVAYAQHAAQEISGLGDDRVVVYESDIQIVIRDGK